jgi:sortase A
VRVAGSSFRSGWILKLAQITLTVVGTLALGYCLATFLEARFFQATEARRFAQELRVLDKRKPTALSPITHIPKPDKHGVVGSLQISRIGVSVMVVEGVDASDLRRAAGHIPGTALPWESGNVGIAGHRDGFFRPLRSIQKGDMVAISTLRGICRYRVSSTSVVAPDDTQVLFPTGHDSLTLITCFPFDYIGSAPKRFVVRAERTD